MNIYNFLCDHLPQSHPYWATLRKAFSYSGIVVNRSLDLSGYLAFDGENNDINNQFITIQNNLQNLGVTKENISTIDTNVSMAMTNINRLIQNLDTSGTSSGYFYYTLSIYIAIAMVILGVIIVFAPSLFSIVWDYLNNFIQLITFI